MFIIIAVVVVAIALLIYFFWPELRTVSDTDAKNPSAFIQACIEDEIEEGLELISLQGGSIDPEHYFLYQDNKIEYLCYTNEYYKLCTIQRPFLKDHIESEIKNEITEEVQACFQDLKNSYEEDGYDVELRVGTSEVNILPEKVVASFNHELTLTKGDVEKFDSFNVIIDNNLYDFIGIINDILGWESTYGEAEPTIYMLLYHDLKIEKIKQEDETKIYILTNINTKEKFQFVSRSLAFPPGY